MGFGTLKSQKSFQFYSIQVTYVCQKPIGQSVGSDSWFRKLDGGVQTESNSKVEILVMESAIICRVTENLQFHAKRTTGISHKLCWRLSSVKESVG